LNYEHIIWDWNGTIVDDAQFCVFILNDILCKRDLPNINLRYYREHFSFPVNLFYKKLGLPCSGKCYDEINRLFITHYKKEYFSCNLHSGVLCVIDKLMKLGAEQSVLSAGKESDIIEFVNYYKLSNYFSSISGVQNIRASGKKEISEAHRQNIMCTNDKLLLVGDTIHDLEIAEHLGIDCVLFSNGHNNYDVLLGKTSRVIKNYERLLSFIS
jgi:phosphoglycolate phosphatase